MPCERYRDALADRAAGGPARPAVEAHVAACAECRAELETLRRALSLADSTLRALVAGEASLGLRDRIRRAMTEADDRSRRSLTGWPFAWTAALGGSVLAAAVFIAAWRSGSLARGPHTSPAPTTAEEPGRSPVPETPRSAAPAMAANAGPAAALRAGRSPSARTSRARDMAATTTRRPRALELPPDDPEVLVPPGEAEGLWRFAADLRERVVDPASLLASAPSAPLVEPQAIDLVPLEMVTLESSHESHLEEGVRP